MILCARSTSSAQYADHVVRACKRVVYYTVKITRLYYYQTWQTQLFREIHKGLWIGDFWVAFRLCFKASSGAKAFIWKSVLFTCKWTKICVWIKLISIWKASHLDSLWNRGERQLENRLLDMDVSTSIKNTSAVFASLFGCFRGITNSDLADLKSPWSFAHVVRRASFFYCAFRMLIGWTGCHVVVMCVQVSL